MNNKNSDGVEPFEFNMWEHVEFTDYEDEEEDDNTNNNEQKEA